MVPDPSAFADQLGFDPLGLGALRGYAELSLADQRIEARRLKIDASYLGPLHIAGGGAIGTLAADGALHLAPDISFAARMIESGPVLGFVAPNAPELGPVRATGRLIRGDEGYRLDDFELDVGTADRLAISAQGKVGPPIPGDLLATELALAVRFGWLSSRVLRPLVPVDLPEWGRAEGQFGLGGTIASPRIHDARLETTSNAGVTLTATGGIASVQTTAPFRLEGVAFQVEGRAPSTTLLARQLGHDWPDFGPVRARASLGDDQGLIALGAIQLLVGPAEEPSIEVNGAIGDVLNFEQLELKGDFRIPSKDLLAFAKIHGNSDVGRLHGKFHLSDADRSMGIEHLEAEIMETNLLSLTMEGMIDDLENLDDVRFQTSLEVPKIADLAAVFDAAGVELERFRFDGKLSGGGRRFDADGRAILGETRFDGDLAGGFRGARPSFRASLHSAQVRLTDLGLSPEASGDATPGDQAAEVATKYLFGRERLPLEALQKSDLDLEVHAQVDAEVDVREPTPRWRLQAETNDLELGDTWRQLETEVPLSGELDLVLDLQARGRSPRDLANSLASDLSLALQRGQIRSRLFGLTTMNPLRWLVARSTRRGYSEIDCFVARFQVDDGVAKLQTLVLDTPNVIAAGGGYIDFARETLDARIRPSAKHNRMVELATPFAITGSLAHPSVEVSATGATARILGRIIVSPVNLLGSLLPFVNDRGRDQDNPCLTLSASEAGSLDTAANHGPHPVRKLRPLPRKCGNFRALCPRAVRRTARSRKLKWLADHHLHARAFFGERGIHAHDEAARPGSDAEAGAPLHAGMQLAQIPLGCHPAELDEGGELEPLDVGVVLEGRPGIERVPLGDDAQLGGVVDRGPVVELLGGVGAHPPQAAERRAGIGGRAMPDLPSARSSQDGVPAVQAPKASVA